MPPGKVEGGRGQEGDQEVDREVGREAEQEAEQEEEREAEEGREEGQEASREVGESSVGAVGDEMYSGGWATTQPRSRAEESDASAQIAGQVRDGH